MLKNSSSIYVWGGWLLISTSIIFFANLLVPLGVQLWPLYLPICLGTMWFGGLSPTITASIFCSVLIIGGSFLSPAGIPFYYDLYNRIIAVITLWLVIAFGRAYYTHQCQLTKTLAELAQETNERKQTEAALRESQQRLELALDGANLGIWDWNIQTQAVEFDGRWANILGYSAAELEPSMHTWEHLLHPDDATSIRQALTEHIEGKTPLYQTESRVKTKSGEWKWILNTGKVMERDAGGKPLRMLGLYMDISKRKQTESHLREQQNALNNMQRFSSVGEITAIIAHQINQPLAVISGYLDNAAQRFPEINANPALREMMDKVVILSQSAATMIKNIRAFTRKQGNLWQRLDVNMVILSTMALLKTEAELKNVTITLALLNDLPFVQGDTVQLQQVILTLVINAMDAIEMSGSNDRRICLHTCSHNNHEIEISVKDTGGGFAPEVEKRLFEPFFTTKKQGIGLGLSLCRSIIEAHGGAISAQSVEHGAQFTILVPIARNSL